MNKKITSADVAAHLGISRSSVSRAFTAGASIDPEKREQILAAAQELGYQPNFFARTLSTPAQRQRSHLVAILVSDFSNPYQSYLFEALSSQLQSQGKQPILLNVKQAEDLDAAILRLSGYQVDGVIAVIGSLPAERFGQCLKLSLPLVTLGRSDQRGIIPAVHTDNRAAGALAAQHLRQQGLTRLGYMAGGADGQASNERYQGFCSVLQTAPLLLQAGSYSYRAGFELGIQQQAALRQLQGVFCACDALAMGLLDSCRQQGQLKVPQDLRIIGCDDVPQAAWQGYQLTTVAQPVAAIAQQALQLLQQIWDDQPDISPVTLLAPELKVRSTG